MCRTTGAGIATNRALSGVTPLPLANPDKRTAPATMGTWLSISSEISSFQEGRSYITGVYNLDAKRLLFATEGRDHQIGG